MVIKDEPRKLPDSAHEVTHEADVIEAILLHVAESTSSLNTA